MELHRKFHPSPLKTLDADVVCIQENHSNSERSVAREISRALGDYECFEVDVSRSHVDELYRLGNAILSKKKPQQQKSVLFPYPSFPLYLPDNKPAHHDDKGFQFAQFDDLRVMNLHTLPLKFLGTSYDTPLGKSYISEMERSLEPYMRAPLLLCGDMNTAHAKTLYGEFFEKYAMTNALPDLPTRPNEKRSDYIFYTNDLVLNDSGIIQTNTDHYLCFARFAF